ncbi:MAG: ATP-binding protein [Nitrospiraceae bacterium]
MKSIRGLVRRSTLGLVAGLVMVFSLLVYWGLDSLLRQYVDGRLLALAETLGRLIEQRPDLIRMENEDLIPPGEGEPGGERYDLLETAHSLRVLSADGRLIWKGSDAVPRPPVSTTVFDQVRRGRVVYDTVDLADGARVRRVSIPIPRHGEVRHILQAEASLLFLQKTLRGLMLLLTIVSGGLVAMAWLGSGWLAGTLLSPMKAMSATAKTISGSERKARFALDAPYEEFQQLSGAFNAMMDRLQKSWESQSRFVDYAAHEMKTPLTVLQANLEVTLHKARTVEEYREALINNLEQVERLVTLTRELLTLTRFAGDSPPVRLTPLALEPLLRELISELEVLADDRQIRLSIEAQPAPLVLGDAQWLKQLLINLLDNALRYTAPGGAVTVRLCVAGPDVTIAVEDTGPGIEPEHLPHLFERFYRTDSARAKESGGTGLGLPIVKEIAEAHRGTITVNSQVGKGSVFTLALPIPNN